MQTMCNYASLLAYYAYGSSFHSLIDTPIFHSSVVSRPRLTPTVPGAFVAAFAAWVHQTRGRNRTAARWRRLSRPSLASIHPRLCCLLSIPATTHSLSGSSHVHEYEICLCVLNTLCHLQSTFRTTSRLVAVVNPKRNLFRGSGT